MSDTTQPITDEVCTDPHIAHLKQTQMQKFKRHSLLVSIGDSCKFVAGPMFGIGIGAAISGGTVVAALPLVLLGAALGFLLVGISNTYAASRIWNDGQFNNYEISAQSTAHHIVQEIKENNMCFVKEAPVRADGKNWQQVIKEQQAAGQAQSL